MGKGYIVALFAAVATIVIAEPLKKEIFNLPPLIHFSDVFNAHSDKEHEKITELTKPAGKPGIPGGSGYLPGIPGIQGHRPGGSGYPAGIQGHRPGGSGYLPGIPGIQGHLPDSSGYLPGIPGHQPGVPGNPGYLPVIPGQPSWDPGYPQWPGGPGIPSFQPSWPPKPVKPPHRPPCRNYYGFPEQYFQPQSQVTYAGYPSYSDYPTYSRSQDVELVERYCKYNDDGSKEYKLVLSNGLTIYQKVLAKNDDKDSVQYLEGYYSDKRDDNTYLTTYFMADKNGYNAKFEISNAPPSFPNVNEMKPLPLPPKNPNSNEKKK